MIEDFNDEKMKSSSETQEKYIFTKDHRFFIRSPDKGDNGRLIRVRLVDHTGAPFPIPKHFKFIEVEGKRILDAKVKGWVGKTFIFIEA